MIKKLIKKMKKELNNEKENEIKNNNKIINNLNIEKEAKRKESETSEWSTFIVFKRFRHSSFLYDNLLYIHGGLEYEKHNNPARALSEINLLHLFQSNSNDLRKLKTFLNKKSGDSSSVKSSLFFKNNNDNNDLSSGNMENITVSDQVVIGSTTDQKENFQI